MSATSIGTSVAFLTPIIPAEPQPGCLNKLILFSEQLFRKGDNEYQMDDKGQLTEKKAENQGNFKTRLCLCLLILPPLVAIIVKVCYRLFGNYKLTGTDTTTSASQTSQSNGNDDLSLYIRLAENNTKKKGEHKVEFKFSGIIKDFCVFINKDTTVKHANQLLRQKIPDANAFSYISDKELSSDDDKVISLCRQSDLEDPDYQARIYILPRIVNHSS